MKRLFLIFVMLAMAVTLTSSVYAEGPDMMSKSGMAKEKGEPKEVGNTVCPVSGTKIAEGKAIKYTYNGKVYNFCCKMCIKSFNANPEKYIKDLEGMKKGKMSH